MADAIDPTRPDEPDRPDGADRAGLAGELRELGRWLDVPAAPDVRAAVRTRLAAAPGPARLRLGPDWSDRTTRAAAALLAFALLLAGTLAVSPRARAAVVELFTFGAVRVNTGAPPVPADTGTPTGRFGGPLPGTAETTLAGARAAAPFPVVAPAALGAPDQVLVQLGDRPGLVALRYGPGPGRPAAGAAGVAVELDQFAGTVVPYIDKYLRGSAAEQVRVGTAPGYWLEEPHDLFYVDPLGRQRHEGSRLAAQTLLWQRGGVTLRLEGDLTLAEALAIARSVS